MILITGGGGFLGLHTARYLAEQGHQVLLAGRSPITLPTYFEDYKNNVKSVQADISNLDALKALIKDNGVTQIIHGAAVYAPVDIYAVSQINVNGTLEILEASRQTGVKRVVFLSSVSVYFGIEAELLSEDAHLPFDSALDIEATKKAGEQLCQLYANTCDFDVVVARVPLVWGPGHHDGPGMEVLHGIMETANAGKAMDFASMNIEGKGEFIVCYVRDCAKALGMLTLAPQLNHLIYNFAQDENVSLRDLEAATRKRVPDITVTYADEVEEPGFLDVALPVYNNQRIKEDTGFVCEYDTDRAVGAYLDWLRDETYS